MNTLKSSHILKLSQQLDLLLTHHTPINWEPIVNFPAFKTWQKKLISGSGGSGWGGAKIKEIQVQQYDLFGSGKVGFLKFKVINEANVPGIVLLRGGSVAILVVLEDQNNPSNLYTLLVEQQRFAVPSSQFYEIPAGMLDTSTDDIKGKAIEELEEETGLDINPKELEDLLKRFNSCDEGVLTSPGLLDEAIHLYSIRKKMTLEEIEKLDGQLKGNREEGELIKIKLVKLEEVGKYSKDMKTLFATQLFLNGLN